MAGSGSGYVVALAYGAVSTTTYAGTEAGIAAAVAALGSNGGEIYLGPGSYSITTGITINGPIRFVGGGWGTILTTTSGAGGITLLNFSSGSSGSEVTSLRMNGAIAGNTTQTAIAASQRIRVQNVLFSGTDASHGFGLQVVFGVGSDGSIVTDCQFERLQGTANTYSVFISGAQNCRVSNSAFNSVDGLHAVYMTGASNVGATYNIVSGCQFTGYIGRQVRIYGSSATNIAAFNRVQNCVSSAATMTTDSTNGAISLGGGSAILAAAYTFLNTVSDCTVSNSGAHGIEVLNAKDNTIRACSIYAAGKHGLYIDGAANTMVKSLVIYDPSTTAANTYDGVNISNSTFTGTVVKSSNCCFENVMVRKSPTWGTAWRYAFNHVDSASATQAVALEFRDCQGTQGASGVFNNIPGDARYAVTRTDDYAASTSNYHRISGALYLTVPTGGTAVPLTVVGTSGTVTVDAQGDIVTSGALESSLVGEAIRLSGAGTSSIQQTGSGQIRLNVGSSGNALRIDANNTVIVNNTVNPGGQQFYVNGTSRLAGTLVVTGTVTLNSSLFASTTVQTVTNNATSQTLTGGKLVLSNTGATNLATLTGSAVEGELLWIEATNGYTTLKDGTGNLYLAGDFGMTADDTCLLRYSSTKGGWEEVARAIN